MKNIKQFGYDLGRAQLTHLTKEQRESIDAMLSRRMTNTGESQREAADNIIKYLNGHCRDLKGE